MTEGEIRQAALMFSLVAKMEAVKSQIEGMKADNAIRKSRGKALSWNGTFFTDAAIELFEISRELKEKI
jgi:hypothetical protein